MSKLLPIKGKLAVIREYIIYINSLIHFYELLIQKEAESNAFGLL